MKIGIVTFHNAHNYGAILQTTALKTFITNLGHKCFIIEHDNEKITGSYKPSFKAIFKDLGYNPYNFFKIIPRFIFYLSKNLRYKIFARSINNLYHAIPLKESKPDLIVFGSDQIWNGQITGNDKFYYGQIEASSNIKRISYAASIGFGSNQFLKDNKDLLENFESLGVREESLQEELKKLNYGATLNVDPTLLLNSEEWDEIFNFKDKEIKDYIFVYAMRSRDKVLKLAKQIAKHTGHKIVEVRANTSLNWNSLFNTGSYGSVRNFVKKLRNARAVITDSFHGTVFSIIYEKPFYSVKLGDGGDDRVDNLLKTFNLRDHFISSLDSHINLPSCIENLLKAGNNQIENSILYLKNSLK